MSILSKIKLIGTIIGVVAAFILGAKLGSTHKVETVTKEVKGETVTVFKDRIITVTKIVRPDGTTEETTKTEEKDKTEKKKESKTDPVVVSRPSPKYSLGYTLRPKWPGMDREVISKPTISHGVTAGYHMGYNVWLKAGAIPADSIYTLGIEIQF